MAPSGEARTKILRATLALIGSDGIGAVTNRNVARAAGVSLGSLTYHFDSQSALVRETLGLFLTEEVERLRALADRLEGAQLDAEQGAGALQALLSQEPERRLAKLEILLEAARDERLRPAAMQCFAAYDDLAAAAGTALDVDGAAELAPMIVALIDGLQLRRLAGGDEELDLARPLLTLLRALRG